MATIADLEKAEEAVKALKGQILKMSDDHALELAHQLKAYDAAVLHAQRLRAQLAQEARQYAGHR